MKQHYLATPKKKPNKQGKSKPPFDLTAPYDAKSFKREMNAATRLQFKPLQRQLGREEQASRFRDTKELPAYYQQYRDDLARLRGESQGAYDAANAKIAAFSQAGTAQDAATRQGMEQRAMADAALRGVQYDPSTLAGLAGAESARSQSTGASLAQIAGQGANQFAYLANREGIAHQAQREAQDREYARTRGIFADQRELAQKKGDFKTQFRADARKSERDYLNEVRSIRSDRQIAKLEERGRNKRNAADNATSQSNAQLSQKGQNKRNRQDNRSQAQRQEDKQKFDKKQANKDRKLKKKLD